MTTVTSGSVVSVNVGIARDVEWRGRTVRTAIWKAPVAHRVWAGRLNIAGDEQADLQGHGGEQRAIMVYQLASYRYWAQHLGRSDFVMGQFGENLTVEDLSDEEVCIGDRFRIGGAVVEVSQPRVSCFKLGLRLDHAAMPALVVAHRRPGFYLRVLEEGEIGAGDDVQLLERGPEAMSVAEVDALLYQGEHPKAALERALRIPALSPGWQGSMRELLKASESGRSGNAGLKVPQEKPAWRGFRALRVLARTVESEDVTAFVLADPSGRPLPAAKPGQHLAVRVVQKGDGQPLLRNYSLCGGASEATYRIAVKREPDGAASRALHDEVEPGDGLEVSAPRGEFVLAETPAPVVLISAGVGVTPVLAMLRALVDAARGACDRRVWWIYATRDGAHHPFAEEVRSLARGAAVKTCVAYSRPREVDLKNVHYDKAGHLDEDVLSGLGLPATGNYYLCGPHSFMNAVAKALTRLGIEPGRISREAFGGEGPHSGVRTRRAQPPPGPEGVGPQVTLLRSAVTARWSDRFSSLLEFAEACEAPVRWVCRTGVCHQCETGLVDGKVSYALDPLDPPSEGAVLICCARPFGDVVLDL